MTSPSTASSRTRSLLGLAAAAVLAVVTVFSLLSVLPPKAQGVDAPAGEFSAGRAVAHVDTIGEQIHVAGSAAAVDVRDYIVDTMESYGISTQLQDGVGASANLGDLYAMAEVSNVVAVLPGSDPTGKLFLVAHYDSVQVSHGANDDGAGVATLLETARALTEGPQPRNDIVFVFTDAEEACLCGAEAFVGQNPLAADGGVVLNFEARGANGPVVMFETARGNAGVIDVYDDAAPYPVATSFAVEVYRILPNDTDFSPFRDSGRFSGLNAAYIDGSAVYHSPQDTPAYFDTDTLQHHGSNALALTRAFGNGDIAAVRAASTGDATYFPVFGTLVTYPGWWVWPLAILALLAVAGFVWLCVSRRVFGVGRFFAGFGLAVIPLLAAAVLAQLLWWFLTLLRPGYADMLDPWRPGWFRAAVVALVLTATLTWYGLLRRRFGAWNLAAGGLAWLAVLGVVFAAVVPGGSYLAALPALAGGIACSVGLLLRVEWARLVVVTLGAITAVVILAPTVMLFFPALGLATGAAGAIFTAMLTLALLPVFEFLYPLGTREDAADRVVEHLDDPDPLPAGQPGSVVRTGGSRRLWAAAPGLVAGGLAVVFVIAGLVVDRFDARHPQPEQLMYALDVDTNVAKWVSTGSANGAWVSQFVSTKEDLGQEFPVIGDDVTTGPAQNADLPAPTVTVTSDVTTGAQRTLTLQVTPQRDVRLVYLELPGVDVAKATVQGREVPAEYTGDDFGVLFHAPPEEGITVELVLDATGPVDVRVMDGSDGLTDLPGFTPRPPDVTAEGSHDSDLVVVAKTYTV